MLFYEEIGGGEFKMETKSFPVIQNYWWENTFLFLKFLKTPSI